MRLAKRIERSGKRALYGILGRMLAGDTEGGADFDRDQVSSILVVRQDSRLGNLVLMTPLLAGLREAFPIAEIDVLVADDFPDVYRHCPFIDDIVVFDKHKARVRPWWYPSFVRRIRSMGYDLAVDVSDGRHSSFNNLLLTAFSGARHRIGYDRGDARNFLDMTVPPPGNDVHMSDAMFGLAKALAPDTAYQQMRYFLSDAEREFAGRWLGQHGLGEGGRTFAAIHPGGRGAKQWGTANFSALIDRIDTDMNLPVVCIAGPGEDELVGKIRTISATGFAVLEGVDVGDMAAVIERCSLFISNDTGPMHVASALNRPTIGIFTSSNFRHYGPRGRLGRAVVGGKRKPAVDDVMVAILDMFEENRPDGTDDYGEGNGAKD